MATRMEYAPIKWGFHLIQIPFQTWFNIHTYTSRGTRERGPLRHCACVGRSRLRFPMKVTELFSWLNPSSRIMALRSTKPLTEISTRNLPGSKGQAPRKADNLTAICKPTGGLDVAQLYGPPRTITFSLIRLTGMSDKGMVRSDMSKPALIFFSLQKYTQQNPLSKF
jgi:hypothetical protein